MKLSLLRYLPLAAFAGLTLTAHAALIDLLPNLGSEDLDVRTQAMNDLMAETAHVSRPGADAERVSYATDICSVLSDDPSPAVAAELLRQLQRIGGEESIVTLEEWLKHPDEHVRDDARQALERNPSPRGGAALQKALAGADDPRFLAGILASLGARGEAAAVPAIAPHLASDSPIVATAAIKALGGIPDARSAKALFRARSRSDHPHRDALTATVIDLAGVSQAREHNPLAKRIYHALLKPEESEAVQFVAVIGIMTTDPKNRLGIVNHAYKAPKPFLLGAVAEAAGQLQSPDLNQAIASRLSDTPPEFLAPMLGVLEFSGDSSLAEHVLPLLASEQPGVAAAAAAALARIGTLECVDPLIAAAADLPEAQSALGVLDVPGAEEQIRKLATTGEASARTAAVEALGDRGADNVVPLLLDLARDPDGAVSGAALEAITKTAQEDDLEPVIALMFDSEDPRLGRRALDTVIKLLQRSSEPGRAVGLLTSRLPDASSDTQKLIFRALQRTGTDAALDTVQQTAVGEPETEAGQVAFKSLCAWPETNAIPVLLNVAEQEQDLSRYVAAMRGLTRLLGKETKINLDICSKALDVARRPEEIKLVLSVIGKSKDTAALETIAPYLEDPEVSKEAQAAEKAVRAKRKKRPQR